MKSVRDQGTGWYNAAGLPHAAGGFEGQASSRWSCIRTADRMRATAGASTNGAVHGEPRLRGAAGEFSRLGWLRRRLVRRGPAQLGHRDGRRHQCRRRGGPSTEGIADPERTCIVGWSYGGYAALMGAMREPDLYRCVVSIAGVADLRAVAPRRNALLSAAEIVRTTRSDRIPMSSRPAHRCGPPRRSRHRCCWCTATTTARSTSTTASAWRAR